MGIEYTYRKGRAGGYAGLDSAGKVPAGQLPAASGGTVSTTPLASIQGFVPGLVAGQSSWQDLPLDPTAFGFGIGSGDDYWGSPGTAAPLDLAVDVNGRVLYPAVAENHLFDICTFITARGDAADDGKHVFAEAVGNDGVATTMSVLHGGWCFMAMNWVDRVFPGDVGAAIAARLDLSELTLPIVQSANLKHVIMQR